MHKFLLSLLGILLFSLPIQAIPDTKTTFRLALLVPSTGDDASWSQPMIQAAENLTKNENISIEIAVDPDGDIRAKDLIREFATTGTDLILCHGSQYGELVNSLASDFPEVGFAWGSSGEIDTSLLRPNVFTYRAASEEAGFINGVIASLLTSNDRIGVISPIQSLEAERYIAGCRQALEVSAPDVELIVMYTKNFKHTTSAHEAAKTLVDMGVDVLMGLSQQSPGAIEVAKNHQVMWLAVQADQAPLAPDVVIASQVYDWSGPLIEMIHSTKRGQAGGKHLVLSFANGGLSLSFNKNLPIPSDLNLTAQKLISSLINGNITLSAPEQVVPKGDEELLSLLKEVQKSQVH